MSIVTLLSGGMDSCLMSVLTKETGRDQKPLFINYGQLNYNYEYKSVMAHASQFGFQKPTVIDVSGYGKIISSGLTDSSKHIVDEAFLPGRNMLFLLIASSFALQNKCSAISIGLLREDTAIFPDQTNDFIYSAEQTIAKALGQKIEIAAPLRDFYKKDVIELAREKGIVASYSCHAGGEVPCGMCISCMEFKI
ncbi:MAG: 7-cyano-7-deazaguanine synthase [Desulfobacula sp.]|uniref:7-cyano-7-deazaguanine synthase n=1 Tax=Desulfobacula sp. TaxID=2593537 RepID=UPI001D606398|nr:7-cyano-7-deazaguanine synthase [Desulfobacula sp.]MBT3804286.1 7-cyano-7-deazaguanine synthase [Desulfobacula sp.]MBT4198166.1 7-cyano-7-deazaguanine synthase [Desulfobacula sp.]MBT4506983.1 7-cyano-7-deazaguanine synthase [Desulfobacula sp.]MBT5544436.1 7-cyano-7-deazaguanine synthase [Desulfobacula sp.]